MSDLIQKIKEQQNKDEMLRSSLEINIRLYTDPSHFFYELLQNAEDAQAKIVKFVLYKDRLEVFHDGKPFTFSNLQSLCNVGKSDKIGKLNQIGEFGVGFKAVFSICDTVKLYSEPSHFRNQSIIDDAERFSIEIVDFVAPNAIEFETIDNAYTTRFVFPYCVGKSFSGYKTINELTVDLSKKLQNLGITTLLFMQNLELIEYEINIEAEQKKGEYFLDKKEINDHCMFVSALGNSKVTDKDISKYEEISYLKFSRPLDDQSSKTVDIAFPVKVDENGDYICVNSDSKYISVYFPTETESKLGFIVQGPFRTTPDRAKIPTDNEDNKIIAQKIALLLKDSLLEIRNDGKLNTSFLKILPLKIKSDTQYSFLETDINRLFLPLYDVVLNLFVNDKIIKSLSGKYVKASEAKIARSKELTGLFNDAQLSLLINDGKEYYWLPTNITADNRDYSLLFDYFTKQLKIQAITPESLKTYIDKNEQFFSNMTDEWLIKFYNFLPTVKAAVISSKGSLGLSCSKIIKTSEGFFVAAEREEGGRYIPNVFLQSRGFEHLGINFVDGKIYESCRNFFDNILHLQKPNEYEICSKDIRLRYESLSDDPMLWKDEQHIKDVKFLIKYYSSNESEIKEIIKECFKFRCDDGARKNIYEDSIYMPIGIGGIEIKQYFKYLSNNKYYIDIDFYLNNGITAEQLYSLGILNNIVTGTYSTEIFCYSFWQKFSIEKIDEALRYISNHPNSENSKIKSQVIMSILFTYSDHLSIDYSNIDYSNNVCELIRHLRGEKDSTWDRRWVYTNNGELVSTYSISKYDLDEKLYGPVKSDSVVYQLLGFIKTDADKADELRNQVSAAVLESYFFDELKKRYNITPERLQEIIDVNDDIGKGEEEGEDEFFEFPTLPVKNIDALKKHIAEVLAFAEPVRYGKVIRSIRVSNKPAEARAYVRSIYRYVGAYKFACQMCHKPSSDIEAVQIFPNPKTELDQIHLCLCPNCAAKYRKLIASDGNVELLKDVFLNKNIGGKEFSDKIVVSVGEYEVWFTQTHFAEVQELLRLMDSAKSQKLTDEIVVDEESGEESGLSVYQGYLGKIFKKKSRRNKGYDYIGKVIKVDKEYIYIDIIERFDEKTEKETKLSLGFNVDAFDIDNEQKNI